MNHNLWCCFHSIKKEILMNLSSWDRLYRDKFKPSIFTSVLSFTQKKEHKIWWRCPAKIPPSSLGGADAGSLSRSREDLTSIVIRYYTDYTWRTLSILYIILTIFTHFDTSKRAPFCLNLREQITKRWIKSSVRKSVQSLQNLSQVWRKDMTQVITQQDQIQAQDQIELVQ